MNSASLCVKGKVCNVNGTSSLNVEKIEKFEMLLFQIDFSKI